MSTRARIILFVVLAVLVVGGLGAWTVFQSQQIQPPSIAGQQAPSQVRGMDFGLRYDVHCSFGDRESTIFRGCKVVGFTGPDQLPGKFGGSSLVYFDRWLILELNDGRLAYIPPTSLKYLEVAK
ncbi:MAG: hypothetical protein MUF18_01115 [Fimbriiglobus sp.]|nr:hypothetical protein [Fimbriiglobus sp.]